MCVYIVHAAVDLTVNAGKVLGTHVAGFLPERREEEDTIAQCDFGVADAAVVHCHAEALLEAEGIPQEGEGRGSILVGQVGDDCLHREILII